MGTSASFGGARNSTPLLPSWAESPEPAAPPSAPSPDAPPSSQPDIPPVCPGPLQPPGKVVVPRRFQHPRSDFSRFVSSGGANRRALGRALREHVRSVSGGAQGAGKRMATSGRAAVNIIGVLRDVRDRGLDAVLRSLSLGDVAGKSPKEVLLALTDIVCEPGGTLDEAIARDAFVETILDQDLGEDLNTINDEQIEAVVTGFLARSIADRVINDIGVKIDVSALSAQQANQLTQFLNDFVIGAVRDRVGRELAKTRSLGANQLRAEIQKIYQIAFQVLESEAAAIT